jgi:hypothetical protein
MGKRGSDFRQQDLNRRRPIGSSLQPHTRGFGNPIAHGEIASLADVDDIYVLRK